MSAAETQQSCTTVLLGQDGSHHPLVRRTVVLDEAKQLAEQQRAAGKSGWIAEIVGGYFDPTRPQLLIRTEVGRPSVSMGKAVQAFWTRRASVMK